MLSMMKDHGARGISLKVAVAVLSGMAMSHVRAEGPSYTLAEQNPDPQMTSQFTLDFGPLGGKSVGNIADTDIVMRYEFDPALGTAQFLDYFQNVESLTLPDGQGGPGIETGAITIGIADSVSVALSFDPATGIGEWETVDTYVIYFEGDLSAFGIESPFIFKDVTSNGTIVFDDENSGRIEMVWAGDHVIGKGPFAIPFTYTCFVNTVFVLPEQSDFNGDGAVDRGDIPFFRGCFTGEAVEYDEPVCEMADYDLDGDVDRDDLPVFRADLNASR